MPAGLSNLPTCFFPKRISVARATAYELGVEMMLAGRKPDWLRNGRPEALVPRKDPAAHPPAYDVHMEQSGYREGEKLIGSNRDKLADDEQWQNLGDPTSFLAVRAEMIYHRGGLNMRFPIGELRSPAGPAFEDTRATRYDCSGVARAEFRWPSKARRVATPAGRGSWSEAGFPGRPEQPWGDRPAAACGSSITMSSSHYAFRDDIDAVAAEEHAELVRQERLYRTGVAGWMSGNQTTFSLTTDSPRGPRCARPWKPQQQSAPGSWLQSVGARDTCAN